MSSIALNVPVELLRKMSKPGPRYTSYPPVPVFKDSFGPEDFAAALRRLGETDPAERPLSVYVHIPFCRGHCYYCACNVVRSQEPQIASRYLDLLDREIALVASYLGPRRRRVTQLHVGGGTPTYLDISELERLHAMLAARFDLGAAEEMAIELDPRVTTRDQLAALARRGWNRASFGVQDFTPEVQRAVNRVQTVEQTWVLIQAARTLGYKGINIDLIYGLPLQRASTFERTIGEVLRMRPDRIALYNYAHVPWIQKSQELFDPATLPGPEEKFALFKLAVQRFTQAGYRHLGMDHFALPDDELSIAFDQGRLHRNFQGYTVKRAEDLLALGLSSISDLAGVYAQNEKELDRYKAAIEAGRLATAKGHALSEDDLKRRRAIISLMAGTPLPANFATEFAAEIAALEPFEKDGLVKRGGKAGLEITPLGRVFLRNIAMVFDRYLPAEPGERRFSRTV